MEIIVKGADFSENRIGVVARKINTAVFNGTSAFAEITPIVLSSDGDYIEFVLAVNNTNIGKYFSFRVLWTYPSMGVATNKLSLRLNNNAWAVNSQTVTFADVQNANIKIAYEGTNVKVYIDNVLTFTYDNSSAQAGLTFAGFGKYQTGQTPDFWAGSIKKVRTNKYNDGEWCGIDEFPGWTPTDVVIV